MKQQINEVRRMQQLAGIKENENNMSLSQMQDDIEELEVIKSKYESKGDIERAAKIQDKIDILTKYISKKINALKNK